MGIVVKGSRLWFFFKDGSSRKLPAGYGIIHDPDGENFDKCEVFFGPVKKTQRKPEKTNPKATKYFGAKYTQRIGIVNVPAGPWKDLGEVIEIQYQRTKGSQYAGNYFHPFKRRSPMLSKCKSYYRLSLSGGCIVDDRGFVFP